MENPATWTAAEHVIGQALEQSYDDTAAGILGQSAVRMIADALREAGMLREPAARDTGNGFRRLSEGELADLVNGDLNGSRVDGTWPGHE